MKAKKDNNRDRLGGSGLRKARSELGWSQQQVADRIGTTKVTVNRWENGATFPFVHSLSASYLVKSTQKYPCLPSMERRS